MSSDLVRTQPAQQSTSRDMLASDVRAATPFVVVYAPLEELGFTYGARTVSGTKYVAVEHAGKEASTRGIQDGHFIIRIGDDDDDASDVGAIVAALESQKRPLRVHFARSVVDAAIAAPDNRPTSWRCCGGCFVVEIPSDGAGGAAPLCAAAAALDARTDDGTRKRRRGKPKSRKIVAKAGLAVAVFGAVLAAVWPLLQDGNGDGGAAADSRRQSRAAQLGDCPKSIKSARESLSGMLDGSGYGGDGGGAAAAPVAQRVLDAVETLLIALAESPAPPPSDVAVMLAAAAQLAIFLWMCERACRVWRHLAWIVREEDADDDDTATATVAAWDAILLTTLVPGPAVFLSSAAASYAFALNGGELRPTASALAASAVCGCAALGGAVLQRVGRCDAVVVVDDRVEGSGGRSRSQRCSLLLLLLTCALCFASLVVALEGRLPWVATLRRVS